MKEKFVSSRRNFIKQSTFAGAALMLPNCNLPRRERQGDGPIDINVSIFSKQLQFLDYKAMSEAAKEMGFDGVDLTVRRKGHVLPERVEEDLPKATEIMQSFGLEPNLFSTGVKNATDPIDRKVLETASQLGYKTYRTAWFKYKKDQDILKTAAFAKKQLTDLAQLNKELKIAGGYQNHKGHYFGSGIWDLHEVVKELSPEQMGSQYDIMHACVEGGKNWEIGFKLIKPFINSLVLKDFLWKKKAGKWEVQYVPMGEGMVDFKRFFALLKASQINVPFSIHVEHDLGGAEHGKVPTIESKEVLKRIKKDLDFARLAYKES